MKIVLAIIISILVIIFIASLFFGITDIIITLGIASMLLAHILAGAAIALFCFLILFILIDSLTR